MLGTYPQIAIEWGNERLYTLFTRINDVLELAPLGTLYSLIKVALKVTMRCPQVYI